MDLRAERLAHGEPAAFAELYDACADRVHHYLGGASWVLAPMPTISFKKRSFAWRERGSDWQPLRT